jgi:hypothetical protein
MLVILVHRADLFRCKWRCYTAEHAIPFIKLLHFMPDRLLELRIRIPAQAWMSVSCERCVVSGRGLYDRPITRPEESYLLWRV